MSRRTTGDVGVWAEMQRQRQRQLEAETRQRRQETQEARAYEQRAAQSYREYKQAEAIRRTEELDARVAALQDLLASGCRTPAFRPSALMRAEELQSLAAVIEGVGRREPDAVVEYFSAALYTSTAWPEGFPRQVAMTYDPAARQLVLDWELPSGSVVPQSKYVRYMYAADQYRETPRPVGQRRALYKEVLAQCMLLVLHELFAADESGALESVALNGFVDGHDPTTGRRNHIFLATVMAERRLFGELHLAQVNAESCLADALRGQLSARPDQLTAIRPGRRPEGVGHRVATHGGDEEPDLYEMDPIAFEGLVAQLFEAMGMRAVTTQRSDDGGVDVHALDPTPIRGGQIVVQVKRYRNTVPPTAVRDLFGTVQNAGANKGVLVTTSGFGPGSHTFAKGKPLELIAGSELVDLLRRHGLRGRLGDAGRRDPAAPLPPALDPALPDDYNVLGMSWTGSVALDMCALVCRGNRILADDHFVFYNNPRNPGGSVRTLPATAPDKAAICAAFDTLPGDADRLVLVAAVDPEANPEADLSGFTDAHIRLLDPALSELGRLEVSDGRPHETALVLGSFRRRSNDDWDFVVGGKGYPGGLEELVRDFGIEVD
ncbi:restriction endonuclease [Streptomyces olivaceus]|uniref:restriction endonuclease n=1 Tax=Streptomyces olivaceus TaxID=47716 RepID=UPI001CCB6095|nr:restriction endonuclease [Streptomyces olivaceus]MBZ6137345.1 restriction endonuclease [Streptomyces olivaceus]MBZ6165546.1 restriction endonuclease [Streptomyces olivaceus]